MTYGAMIEQVALSATEGRSVRAGLLVAALLPVVGHIGLLGLASHRR